LLEACGLCTRGCGIDRLAGETGFLRRWPGARVALVSLSPVGGAVACPATGLRHPVFFSRCNLRCVFCQNYAISQDGAGQEVSVEAAGGNLPRTATARRAQSEPGVSTPYVPHILAALDRARGRAGFPCPSSIIPTATNHRRTISALAGYVDIYLPDLKYLDPRICCQVFGGA